MLSTAQKADILVRAGIALPTPLAGKAAEGPAYDAWRQQVEDRFANYAAARAARSMREAEDTRTMDRLRRANSLTTRPVAPEDPHDE